MRVEINDGVKIGRSDEYSFNFDLATGKLETWKGYDQNQDSEYNPHGCIIADIEVTTKCVGVPQKGQTVPTPCPFCYKANNANGYNMSFETFKEIVDKMPDCLTQIAFGADSRCESNPDIWKMMEYCLEKKIIPNITVADISDEVADKLAKYCGGVAVSCYENVDVCFDSVKRLTDRGVKTNIHLMLSQETKPTIAELLTAIIKKDPRLEELSYVTFLSLKQKGRGESYGKLTDDEFKSLVVLCLSHNIKIGFDSCSSRKYMKAVKDLGDGKIFEKAKTYVASCESTMESIYFSAEGKYYPCSFCEELFEGVHISDMSSVADYWKSGQLITDFRQKLMNTYDEETCTRACPIFDV